MKRKITGAITFAVFVLGTIFLQIYNISLSFVNGNIGVGILFSVMFVAYLIYILSIFKEGD